MQSAAGSAKLILVGQQVAHRDSEGFRFLRERSELARGSGRKNKTRPANAGRGYLGNTKRRRISEANPRRATTDPATQVAGFVFAGMSRTCSGEWLGK